MKMWEKINEVKPKILSYLISRNIEVQDVEDVFQDCCFLILSKNEEPKNLEAMLMGYAKMRVLRQYRWYAVKRRYVTLTKTSIYNDRDTFETEFEHGTVLSDESTPESIYLKEQEPDLKSKLKGSVSYIKLTSRNKNIINYRIFHLMPEKDIAKKLKVSRKVVEMTIHRFKHKLIAEEVKKKADEQKRYCQSI